MTDTGYRIRTMQAADVETVLEIAKGLEQAPHWPRSAYLTALDPHATPRRIALVAADEASDAAIGFAIASVVANGAELETVAVRESRQRQGAGRVLIDQVLRKLRVEGVKDVWLEVRESNLAGAGLYRAAGFLERGRRRGYYADPVEDAVVMGVTLS